MPIRFFSGDGLMSGRCLNISKSGMLAEFDEPVAVWLVGEITILLVVKLGCHSISKTITTA